MIDVTMPQLGESVTEGTVTKWLVKEGDAVQKDQPIVEIGTDKADSEVPSPANGRIAEIVVTEDNTVEVHSVLCRIEEGSFASASSGAGVVSEAALSQTAGSIPNPEPSERNLATPTARKAALEHDVDLTTVKGSGERGRITKDDVLRAKTGPEAAASKPAAPPATAKASGNAKALAQMVNAGGGFVPPIPGTGYGAFKVPAYRPAESDKVIPFTRRRRLTADHMTYSKFVSPHVVTVAEVDLHAASSLRNAHKARYKQEGLALTMLAFVVVATARALRENPALNARVLDDSYVQFGDVNIGVAVDSPDGLVVPVVRRADELGVRGIVRAIDDVARRARSGKITIDDLSGATFAVSNPGLKGNLFGGAIINQPNVGILRMGEIKKRVVVVEGPDGEDMMAIHPVMYMALSYDHRVVDGVAANSFLWRVTEILEKADFEV